MMPVGYIPPRSKLAHSWFLSYVDRAADAALGGPKKLCNCSPGCVEHSFPQER